MWIELFQLLVHTNSFHHSEKMMQISSCQGSGANASSPSMLWKTSSVILLRFYTTNVACT